MKTVNRIPKSFSVPTAKQIADKYFNQNNWKGINDDKNFLGVDQESFADCENVYVDVENVLRSRPSLKTDEISTIKKYKFGNVIIILNVIRGIYGGIKYIDIEGSNIFDINTSDVNNVKLYYINNIIYIQYKDETGQECFKYYYKDTNGNIVLKDVDDKVYVPIVTNWENGYKQDVGAESPNELTSSYRERFNWTKDNTNTYELDNFSKDVVNNAKNLNNVDVTINKNKYVFDKFTEDKYNVFVDNGIALDDSNYLMYTLSGTTYKYPLVTYKKGIIIKTKIVDRDTTNGIDNTYVISYSIDGGKNFKTLPSINKAFGIPVISDDGSMICVCQYYNIGNVTSYCYCRIMAYSIGKNENNEYTFTEWTDLIAYTGNSTDIENVPKLYQNKARYAVINVKNDTNFAIQYITVQGNNTSEGDVRIVIYKQGKNEKYKRQNYQSFTANFEYNDTYIVYNDTGANGIQISRFKRREDTNLVTNEASITLDTYTTGNEGVSYNIYRGLLYVCYFSMNNHICVLYDKIFDKKTNKFVTSYIDCVTFKTYIISGTEDTVTTELKELDLQVRGTNDTFVTSKIRRNKDTTVTKLMHNITTDKSLYIISADPLIYIYDNVLYNSSLVTNVTVIDTVVGELKIKDFTHFTELAKTYYFSNSNKLYISSIGANYPDDVNFMLYYPEINTKTFDYDITNLHPISSTEVAIFTEDNIYYCSYNDNIGTYTYYKSKIPLGCEEGTDIITTFDSKYTIFTTKRGLVAMAYQDFISSTEQALTFLSDTIFDMFDKWHTKPVKLCIYKYWICCYTYENDTCFIYDLRTSSWWRWKLENGNLLYNVYVYDNKPNVSVKGKGTSNNLLDTSDVDYYDDVYNAGKNNISWFIKSQKLHLNAVNYTKHIISIILNTVNDGTLENNDRQIILKVNNYRNKVSIGKNIANLNNESDTMSFTVDYVRTFVKKLNYYNVNEIEYTLSDFASENGTIIMTAKPLSLSCITIKYRITNEVK